MAFLAEEVEGKGNHKASAQLCMLQLKNLLLSLTKDHSDLGEERVKGRRQGELKRFLLSATRLWQENPPWTPKSPPPTTRGTPYWAVGKAKPQVLSTHLP